MPKILFVCTGNTCRSPMAAAIAAEMFKDAGCAFVSRGISVPVPSRASENAVVAARAAAAANISEHVSRQIKADDLRGADLVVTMTRSHKSYLLEIFDEARDKTLTLYEIAEGSPKDVKDPYGQDVYAYRLCAGEIKSCLDSGPFRAKLISLGEVKP